MWWILLASGFGVLHPFFTDRVVRSSNKRKSGFIVKIAYFQGSAFIFVFAFVSQRNSNHVRYVRLH